MLQLVRDMKLVTRSFLALLCMCFGIAPIFAQSGLPHSFRNGDNIPDFSRVGYMWGERAIPEIPVRFTVKPLPEGMDATQTIQDALDRVKSPGAVLLKAGTYHVSGQLLINRSGVVLRGETGVERTVIIADGKKKRSLLVVGSDKEPVVIDRGSQTPVIEDVPFAQLWIRVADGASFKSGDRVVIRRPGTAEWIHDIRMDSIPQNEKGTVVQWTPEEYGIDWERHVLKVSGDTLWLDNPVVMALQSEYGCGSVAKVRSFRINGAGVEDIHFESAFNPSSVKHRDGVEYFSDEKHAWYAVDVMSAEHCWVRRISSNYFGGGIVQLSQGAKNVTVSECNCCNPVSIIHGGRRYAYHINGGQLCLVTHCLCSNDRHMFVSGKRVPGPNVFHKCTARDCYSDAGPHHRWATGFLYDCVDVGNSRIDVEDRGEWGTGHGWSGAGFVFWNCKARAFVVQSPWVSAENYAVGCIGKYWKGSKPDNQDRPQGIVESSGVHVSPESLYEAQLGRRLSSRETRISDIVKTKK